MRPFPMAAASTASAISIATARTARFSPCWRASCRRTRCGSPAISPAPGRPRRRSWRPEPRRHAAIAPVAVPDFAEQHLGDWQGLERKPFYAERKVGTHTLWFAPAHERAPGGESFVDLLERVAPRHRPPHRRAPRPRHRRRHPWRHHQSGAGAGARPRPAGGALLRDRELLAHPARLPEPAGCPRPVARRRRQPPPLEQG